MRRLARMMGALLLVALVARLAFAGAVFDRHGRLADFPGKTIMTCPAQDARTAVILAMGQSNIANETEPPPPDAPAHPNVVNFYKGRCMAAAAPLLGASGTGGEWLTLLGDALIKSGRYDRVLLIPAAVGGQLVRRFAEADLGVMLDETADAARDAGYRVTHAIWHQGESDFDIGTDPAVYRALFLKVVDRLRRKGIDAPIFISTTTYCWSMTPWRPNAIQQAQRPEESLGVFKGVDSDAFDQTVARFDDCHLSRRGQQWAAAAEAEAIAAYDAGRR